VEKIRKESRVKQLDLKLISFVDDFSANYAPLSVILSPRPPHDTAWGGESADAGQGPGV
jgi:hypothetical protein